MNAPAPDAEVHIASFVIQHRETAADALAAMIREHADLDLALAGDTVNAVSVTTEFNTLFETITAISEQVDPVKLNATLTAAARMTRRAPRPASPAPSSSISSPSWKCWCPISSW